MFTAIRDKIKTNFPVRGRKLRCNITAFVLLSFFDQNQLPRKGTEIITSMRVCILIAEDQNQLPRKGTETSVTVQIFMADRQDQN